MDLLREHDIVLRGDRVTLRPLTERDWDVLLRWNQDPEVLRFAEADPVEARTLEEVQAIYRGVSRSAFCFLMEHDGRPIGECWLQEMNLPRLRERYPRQDLRRIDLTIGEKALWGQGLGTEALRRLCAFAFDREGADAVFGCDVAEDNPRSRRAFAKAGFVPLPGGPSAGTPTRPARDLILTRERHEALGSPGGGT